MPNLLDPQPLTPTQRKADRIKKAPARMFNMMLSEWKNSFNEIWQDEDPQAVISELGNDAEEIFNLSAQMVGFLETLKAGSTAATLEKLQPVVFDANGAGTITPVEQPE